MRIPLNINFDYSQNQRPVPGSVQLPKIYQGAPYDQTIRVKNTADGTYRDFTGYDDMRMQVRLSQSKPVLFSLSQADGELIGTTTAFQMLFPAAKTENLVLPISGPLINEVRFVYDIEFILGGVVVERFAQGEGVIVANTTIAS